MATPPYVVKSPVLSEHWYTGGFVVTEANGYRSRDAALYVNSSGSDALLDSGLVLTNISLGTPVVAPGTNAGNGTLGSLTLGGALMEGVYTITFTAATAFNVTRPDGSLLGSGASGTTFNNAELSFKITAGTNANAAGDTYTIQAQPGDVGVTSWTGVGLPSCILYNRTIVTAGTNGKVTVISRSAEVNQAELVWDPAVLAASNVTALQNMAADALRVNNIIFR